MHRHEIHVYPDEQDWMRRVGGFFDDGLAQGDGALVIANAGHRTALGAGRATGWAVSLDAQKSLDRFMKGGRLQEDKFHEMVNQALDKAQDQAPSGRVRAYGEMVHLLGQQDQWEAAIELERLWNRVGGRREFTLLCAYSNLSFVGAPPYVERAVCVEHGFASPTAWRLEALRRPAEPQLQEPARAGAVAR